MKAWCVFTGEYSDYRLRGVYSTREHAEEAARVYGTDDIKEIEVDALPCHPPGTKPYKLLMTAGGDVESLQAFSDFGDPNECNTDPVVSYNHPEWPQYHKVQEVVRMNIWATDEQHAAKIATERRRQLLAENNWYPLFGIPNRL